MSRGSRSHSGLTRVVARPRNTPTGECICVSDSLRRSRGRETTRVAGEAASRYERLDYSIDSLAVLQDHLRAEPVDGDTAYVLGVYVGEVLVRNAENAAWGWPVGRGNRRYSNPAVAVGTWHVDPFEWVERVALGKAHPESSLVNDAIAVRDFAQDPSFETGERIGLRSRRRSNLDSSRDFWRRRRTNRLRRKHR